MAQMRTQPEEVLEPQEKALPNGIAAAALLAAGIGSLALGVVTTLTEASTNIANSLKFVAAVGPLSGKTTIAVIVWLVSWLVLHFLWRKKEVDFTRVFVISLVLIGLVLLGTFPPFFDLFAG
jgi:hypothetical protein